MIIKQYDIYWVNLDPTIGSEMKKKRPCIVVSPDIMNKIVKTVLVVPITKTIINWPFRTTIRSTGKISSAACDQLRAVSKKRILNKAGSLDVQEQRRLMYILQEMFA